MRAYERAAGTRGDFDSVYTAFKRWVIDTAKVRDTVLVGDAVLRFTAESAEPMRR
jgi:hypothetical protein